MIIKKKINKLIATFLAISMIIISGSRVDVSAANKAITVPTKSNYKHTSVIGKNRADTSNIIVSNSRPVNNFILVNQYNGLAYALMNSANAAKKGAYILPVNESSIPSELQYFLASNESKTNIKISGNSKSFTQSFINDASDTYASTEKNILNDLSKASVNNLNKNFRNSKTVFIVNPYKGIADAMSIAPVSYRDQTPILFTTKEGSSINGYSKEKGVRYIAVGGKAVVSDSLVKKYGATRLAGNNRYETNRVILKKYYPKRNISYFTNGDTLVDALSSVHITKDNGIILVNKNKNQDLLRNINTYQIGGVSGYDFKYKNEKGKFSAVSKLNSKKKAPENNATTRNRVYKHKIDTSKVHCARIKNKKVYDYMINRIRNNKFDFYGKKEDIIKAFGEIKNEYLDIKERMYIYHTEEGHYYFMDADAKKLKNKMKKIDPRFNNYKKEIERAFSTMNLNCSNEELISQIVEYICKNYSYKITNERMYTFVEYRKGQCMHYASMFKDMCLAAGIDMHYLEGIAKNGGAHAWNKVVLDGQEYYFDINWADIDNAVEGSLDDNMHGYIDKDYLWCTSNPHGKINSIY